MTGICLDCGALFKKTGELANQGRCATCRRTYRRTRQRRQDARRGNSAQRGYDRQWRAVRKVVLKRDNHTCQWCGAPATTADHVVPLVLDGPRLDKSNLLASCKPCNDKRGGHTPSG